MAKTIKTKEELQASIEKAKIEIRQGENYIKQLQRQNNQQERKLRNHRLIERGAIAESLIANADSLTNEQFKTLLSAALSTAAAREVFTFFKKNNSITATETTPGAE